MSFLLDILGQGDRPIFVRDYRNAYRFRPDQDPPRQQFQGYVNFIFNRDEQLFGSLFNNGDANSNEFRTTISSLVRTADLPGAEFKTQTLNSYNRKKIVNTGVEYPAVNIKVIDTVGNEWLTVLMKYFSYHYMDPRNKQNNNSRDIGARIINQNEMVNSNFGPGSTWDSNVAGYNPNYSAKFFERIDYVLYHGQKAVQYSIFNPVLTSFKPSSIDYSSSDLREFDLTFEYERFTIYNNVNFTLSNEDRRRFEGDESINKFIENYATPSIFQEEIPNADLALKERKLNVLGSEERPRYRTAQSQLTPYLPSGGDVGPAYLPDTYSDPVAVGTDTETGGNFFTDLLSDVLDNGISTAISGGSFKDAALGTALGGFTTVIGTSINDAINAEPPAEEGDTP